MEYHEFTHYSLKPYIGQYSMNIPWIVLLRNNLSSQLDSVGPVKYSDIKCILDISLETITMAKDDSEHPLFQNHNKQLSQYEKLHQDRELLVELMNT